MESYLASHSYAPLPTTALQRIASAGFDDISTLDEISNHPGAVRHHLFHHGSYERYSTSSKAKEYAKGNGAGSGNGNGNGRTLSQPMLFFVYTTGRHGPQNGYRLCLALKGYRVGGAVKAEGEGEDEIDRLEKEIPQGGVEFVGIGEEASGEGEGAEV